MSLQQAALQPFLDSFFLFAECSDFLPLVIMTQFLAAWSGFDSFKLISNIMCSSHWVGPWTMGVFSWHRLGCSDMENTIKSIMVFITSWFISRNLWTLEFLYLFEGRDELTIICVLMRLSHSPYRQKVFIIIKWLIPFYSKVTLSQGSESPKICLVLVPFFSASPKNVLVLVPYFSALALSTKITKIKCLSTKK